MGEARLSVTGEARMSVTGSARASVTGSQVHVLQRASVTGSRVHVQEEEWIPGTDMLLASYWDRDALCKVLGVVCKLLADLVTGSSPDVLAARKLVY